MSIAESSTLCSKLIENISNVFIGKPDVVRNAVLSLISGGHILLEDVPGVGKTLLAKSIAKSIQGSLKRIQFTADLLPTDVTGVTMFYPHKGEFEFRKGPIFSNILLADEINRATPRTQSSLLEAMEEGQVTVDGNLYFLEKPFFVIATQNPIELEGTYMLPFSQMDRFISRLRIGYLESKTEKHMLKEQKITMPIDNLNTVLGCPALLEIQETAKHIKVTEELYEYIIAIIHKTRNSGKIEYGASPRGTLDLMRFSQAQALLESRDYILPDDIKKSAPVVLGHRIILKKGARLSTASNSDVIHEIIESIPVPI
ncbi:MAG TPA: AAA family ATPase [Lentisphaeria bacterium]|nr:MAG: hypothetical protein A2X47_08340 [Lentisphaerae bacterium GWF2_38_69]HBM15833.1 AAA family ATPase [Lentisphaeria bacterium]